MRGSIRKRGKTWYVIVYLGDKKYKWIPIKDDVTGKSTKPMAEKALPDILKQLYDGSFTDNKDMSLKDFMDYWLDEKKNEIKYNTWRQYEYANRLYIAPCLGKIKVDKLRPPHIKQLHKYCFGHKVSKSTVTRVHATIRSALSYAVEMEMIARNVAKLVSAPGDNDDFEINTLSESEFLEFMHSLEKEDIFTHFFISVATGLRLGEVCALRWQDIDFNAKTIFIKHTIGRVKNEGLKLTTTKTKKSKDIIPMPDILAKYLKKHKANQAQLKLLYMGQDYKDQDFVCAWEDGRPFDPSNAKKIFDRALKKYKLRKIRFHDLRHTFGTILVDKNIPLPVIQSMLRHADRRTTERYTHGTKSAKEEAAERINDILKGC